MSKLLVADDEKEIRDILHLLLTAEGYEVVLAENGKQALELADASIDLYILDVNMPEMTGFVAGAKIREQYFAPLLFLTAYSGESDKLMGFTIGADDYIAKPFSNSELLLRIKAHLRRTQTYHPKMIKQSEETFKQEKHLLRLEDLTIDTNSQTVQKGQETIVLTYTEFKILELLVTHRKKIFSLENIYQSVWGDDAIGDGTIMVHIKNIRKKIGDTTKNSKYVKTAWGKGYYVD